MVMSTRSSLFFFLITLLPGCVNFQTYRECKKTLHLKKCYMAGPITEGPATVFVHGTKESVVSKYVHKLDYPLGVVPSAINKNRSVLVDIAHTLNKACPEEFPLENFYFYGWRGELQFTPRLEAAERLYLVLKNHRGPLTVITHSHGSNVALNLAYWVKEYNDEEFKVDRLILLAPPVQEVTKPYINCPLFREVYTFYSSADLLQVGDPQGLYPESYELTPPSTYIPFLSRRTFPPAPHIIQSRVFQDWQSPGHLSFMLPRFIRKLPMLLKVVKEAALCKPFEKTCNCFTVNIPLFNQVPEVFDTTCKHNYIPRSSYYKTRSLLRKSLRTKKAEFSPPCA